MSDNRLLINRFRWDRRRFLKALGSLGVGVAAGGTLQAVRRIVPIGSPRRLAESRLAMGTYVSITAIDDHPDRAREAVGRAYEEMGRLVSLFSRHAPDSPVSVLNATGALAGPPPELVGLIERSIGLSRATHGAFDITVAPLVAIAEARGRGGTYSSPELAEALSLVGFSGITLRDRDIRFARSGMRITLDGIAKGYVVDRISDVLTASGVGTHLVNAGGDIRMRADGSSDHRWTVAVEDPEKKHRYPDVVRMANGAVATSGSYEIYFDDERMFHHIVDPSSGECPRHHTSVSVTAPSVTEADALSTALFVLETESGLDLVDRLPGRGALVVSSNGGTHRTQGWTRYRAAVEPDRATVG